MSEEPREESDQLPEEGPAEQVHDEGGGDGGDRAEGEGESREGGEQASGNPHSAG
jgi:hypothetical protein